MSQLNRREFLAGAAALGASLYGRNGARGAEAGAAVASRPAVRMRPAVNDTVVLGKTGIKTSRLAIGTGTRGGSEQQAVGSEGMNRLLRQALDDGVRWWDTADNYHTHKLLGPTLKEIPRDKVVITSKTWCRDKSDPDYVRKDLERFRKELNTDYIDIVLMHCMEDPEWRTKMKPHMEALSEAKAKGIIRAHGVSCHTLEALEAAAEEPWVEIDLARFNPFAAIMDLKNGEALEGNEKAQKQRVAKQLVIDRVEKALQKMHDQGKAIYAMKIIGEGRFKGDQISDSLRFVLSKPYITGLNIGFKNADQINDISRRIERISMG